MREHEKVIDEKLRHRKKSKTASISNSSKRADHKHQYERVIVKSFLGYRWGRKCSVCGRFDDRLKYALSANSRDFMKAEAIGNQVSVIRIISLSLRFVANIQMYQSLN